MLTAFGLMMWLLLSAQIAKSSGVVHNSQLKPFSTDNCPSYNGTSDSFPLSTNLNNSTMSDEYITFTKVILTFCFNFSYFLQARGALYSPEDFLLVVHFDWYADCPCPWNVSESYISSHNHQKQHAKFCRGAQRRCR